MCEEPDNPPLQACCVNPEATHTPGESNTLKPAPPASTRVCLQQWASHGAKGSRRPRVLSTTQTLGLQESWPRKAPPQNCSLLIGLAGLLQGRALTKLLQSTEAVTKSVQWAIAMQAGPPTDQGLRKNQANSHDWRAWTNPPQQFSTRHPVCSHVCSCGKTAAWLLPQSQAVRLPRWGLVELRGVLLATCLLGACLSLCCCNGG